MYTAGSLGCLGQGPESLVEQVKHRTPCAQSVRRVITDAGHGRLDVSGSPGGRPVGVCRPGPESVLGPTVDIHPPVDPGALERAAKRQDLIRGAKRVFGAGTQKERVEALNIDRKTIRKYVAPALAEGLQPSPDEVPVTVATIAQRLRDDHRVKVSESTVRRHIATAKERLETGLRCPAVPSNPAVKLRSTTADTGVLRATVAT